MSRQALSGGGGGGGGGSTVAPNVVNVEPTTATTGTVTMGNGFDTQEADTTSAAVTVKLPASGMVNGERHRIADIGGNIDSGHATPHALTASGNGNNLVLPTGGLAGSYVYTRDYEGHYWQWSTAMTAWSLV